ncbi:MAG TPA: hypothetical protein VHM31_12280 [Polyangia bacterium]|nr:hypothetical protein [Polyangia bacterium]
MKPSSAQASSWRVGRLWIVQTLLALGASGSLFVAACDGSGKSASDGAVTGGTGESSFGVVLGPLDNHCNAGDGGQRTQEIGICQVDDPSSVPANKSTCGVSFSSDAGAATTGTDDAGESTDAGADKDAAAGKDSGADTADLGDYGPTMYGSAGYDDDCKYYVSWVSTAIKENADTYFTVTAIRAADGKPASCAGIRPDVSLSLTHGVPAPKAPASEIAPGVYKVGPIRFDAPGNAPGHYWTVRFHLYEECSDDPEDSPHGHAAFYVRVP